MLDELLHSYANRILDAACGAGDLAIWLALNGKHVWAFDLSPKAIAVAKKSAELSGVADRVVFQVMDAQSLTYDDGFFDILTGCDCLHHLIKYPEAIQSLKRVLGIGGKGLFVEPLAWNPLVNFLRRVNIRYRGRVGEHMLTRSDVQFLERVFGHIALDKHVVLSILTRFVAGPSGPMGKTRKALCRGMISADEVLQRIAPFVKRYASVAYIRLIRH